MVTRLDYKNGDIINGFLILDNKIIKGKIKIKCKCGNEFYRDVTNIKKYEHCSKCRMGNYPGKICDGCELIEKYDRYKWKMKCHCGNIYTACPRYEMRSSGLKFRNCGCKKTVRYMEKIKDKIGLKFGILKVIKVKKGDKHNILICKCKCGNKIEIKNGYESKQNSCGCLKKENIPKAEKKGNARFKNIEIMSIREMYHSKLYSLDELKDIFKCEKHYLARIIKGKIWKSLPCFKEDDKPFPRPKRRGKYKKAAM